MFLLPILFLIFYYLKNELDCLIHCDYVKASFFISLGSGKITDLFDLISF